MTQRHKVDSCWKDGIDTSTTWTDIEGMMLREINQTKTTTLGLHSHVKSKKTEHTQQNRNIDTANKQVVARGEGVEEREN